MNWLTKIVSTTLVVVTGCALAIVLTAFYMITVFFHMELDAVTFGSMLGFAAAFAGVGYKQFKTKRETSWATDDDGVPYRPVTAGAMRTPPRPRYDVGVFPQRTPIREIGTPLPQQQQQEDESVDQRENAGQPVLPPPVRAPAPEPEPEQSDDWEDVEGA